MFSNCFSFRFKSKQPSYRVNVDFTKRYAYLNVSISVQSFYSLSSFNLLSQTKTIYNKPKTTHCCWTYNVQLSSVTICSPFSWTMNLVRELVEIILLIESEIYTNKQKVNDKRQTTKIIYEVVLLLRVFWPLRRPFVGWLRILFFSFHYLCSSFHPHFSTHEISIHSVCFIIMSHILHLSIQLFYIIIVWCELFFLSSMIKVLKSYFTFSLNFSKEFFLLWKSWKWISSLELSFAIQSTHTH